MSSTNRQSDAEVPSLADSVVDLPEKDKVLVLFPLWELFLALIVGIFFSMLFFFGFFKKLEDSSLDLRFAQRGDLPRTQDIVLVSITDDCIEKIGPWPWKRATHAELIALLHAKGAKTIAFDIMFSEPSIFGEADDNAFADMLAKTSRIVLPQVLQKHLVLDNDTFEEVERHILERPIDLLRYPLSTEGFIDIDYETFNPDGVIRKTLLAKKHEEQTLVSFSLAILSNYLSVNPVIRSSNLELGNRVVPFFKAYEPTAKKRIGSYMINYIGKTGCFEELYYSDVLEGKFSQNTFTNKIVMIGTRAKGISEDVKFTPYGPLSGVEVHANIIHNILSRNYLHHNSTETTITFIMLFALAIGYLLYKYHGFVSNLFCLFVTLFWIFLSIILFNLGFVTDVVPVSLMIPILWAITRLLQQFISLGKKNLQLARKVRELAIINEVSKAVSFMGDLKMTLDSILGKGVQVLDAQHGSLFLLDDQYEELVEKSVIFGIEGEAEIRKELKEAFKLGKGIAGEVFESGVPRLIKNVRKEKSFTSKRDDYKLVRTLICVPLVVKERAIGVMNVVNKKGGGFSQEDLQMAITIANQAAVVIEKARLYNLATIDGLTGLVVHRHMQAKLEEEFKRAKRYNKSLSYLMTDIDKFKLFNDTWGHQTGDVVLREVAKCLMDCARDTDLAARYGGEEFAIILPETELEGAILLAERLRKKVEDAVYQGPEGDLRVTISIGLSSIPANSIETSHQMIQFADEALYKAKENGRNRVEVYVDNATAN